MKKRPHFFQILVVLIVLSMVQFSCTGNSEEDSQAFQNTLLSLFYFASTREEPFNASRDGDIFIGDASQGPQGMRNLSGSNETGDDDDHVCLLDLVRQRTYFMSQRTDIENANGDFDIFTVPSLGGPIVNLTDADSSGDGDDFCNAIHQPTGDLIFTSNRMDEGVQDTDIYRLEVTLNPETGITAPGTLTNLTNLPGDTFPSDAYFERFENLVGDNLLFSALRIEADVNGTANCSGSSHIFSTDVNTPGLFVNVSQQGQDDGCLSLAGSPFSDDYLCGIVEGLDEFGNPIIERIIFSSDQNVGDNSGQQFSTSIDMDIFVVDPGEPNQIYNLSDGFSPADSDDYCQRVVPRRLAGPGTNPLTPEDYAIIFESFRTATGVRNANGNWSDTSNSNFDVDLFLTDMPLQTPGNHIDILTDDDRIPPDAQGSGSDADDKLAGMCGTTALFYSYRDDIEDNPDFDIDLYAVDIHEAGLSHILSLTNNPNSINEDSKDCFLLCEPNLGGLFFASDRRDEGNDHGPSDDTDIFRVRFRDQAFLFQDRSGVIVENVTDHEEGDSYDFALPEFFSMFSNECDTGTYTLESQVLPFDSRVVNGFDGFFDGNLSEFYEDDFGFALTNTQQILFTSERSQPVNEGLDVDIFSQAIPNATGQDLVQNIQNLTDILAFSPASSGEFPNEGDEGTSDIGYLDDDDGLESFIEPQLIPGGSLF